MRIVINFYALTAEALHNSRQRYSKGSVSSRLYFQAYRCIDAWSAHAAAHSKTIAIIFFAPPPQDQVHRENHEIVPFGSEN